MKVKKMKYIFLFCTLFITSFFFAQEAEKTNITVTVKNLENKTGSVEMALFTEDGFMKEPIAAKSSEIKDGEAIITFQDVVAGKYAIIGFHDENDNNKMDFTSVGMPKESYGVSNNQMSFGPPQWNDAQFEVGNEPIQMEIKF